MVSYSQTRRSTQLTASTWKTTSTTTTTPEADRPNLWKRDLQTPGEDWQETRQHKRGVMRTRLALEAPYKTRNRSGMGRTCFRFFLDTYQHTHTDNTKVRTIEPGMMAPRRFANRKRKTESCLPVIFMRQRKRFSPLSVARKWERTSSPPGSLFVRWLCCVWMCWLREVGIWKGRWLLPGEWETSRLRLFKCCYVKLRDGIRSSLSWGSKICLREGPGGRRRTLLDECQVVQRGVLLQKVIVSGEIHESIFVQHCTERGVFRN